LEYPRFLSELSRAEEKADYSLFTYSTEERHLFQNQAKVFSHAIGGCQESTFSVAQGLTRGIVGLSTLSPDMELAEIKAINSLQLLG